jgi:peptide/nickel transport system substrate-binding protein
MQVGAARLFFLLASCLLPLAFTGCSRATQPLNPNVITVAVRTPPNNLDPRLANDETSSRIGQLVFSSLTDLGDDLRARPTLAEGIENPDPLTWIVRLRRGVKFHDGQELTSEDVVYTFGKLLDPVFVSPYKGAYRMLASVRALDGYTVEFKLKEPFVSFAEQLTTPPVVPARLGDIPANRADSLSRTPIGTGPYRFVRYDTDDQVVLAAFTDYFEGSPSNSGVVLKIVPDDTIRGLELRKGSVDMVINQLPPDIVHQFEESGDLQVQRSVGLDFMYVGLNMRDPILSDKRVRHAIGYAINRQAIVDHLRRGLARVARGPLIPPQVWAFEPDVHQFVYDPARAGRLLDDAGYRDPDGDGPLPRLRLSLKVSNVEEFVLQATVIQQDLERVGIDVDLRSYEFATFFADVIKGNIQLYAMQWVGGAVADPDMLRRVFHSQQVPPSGFNRGHYANPEVDRLLDLATRSLDQEERRKYFSAVQKLVAEDAPYIPLWNRTNAIIAQRDLTGLHLNAIGAYQSVKDVRRVAE